MKKFLKKAVIINIIYYLLYILYLFFSFLTFFVRCVSCGKCGGHFQIILNRPNCMKLFSSFLITYNFFSCNFIFAFGKRENGRHTCHT